MYEQKCTIFHHKGGLSDRDSPWTETPWTETSGQRPPQTEIPRQRRPLRNKDPLDGDPPGRRLVLRTDRRL